MEAGLKLGLILVLIAIVIVILVLLRNQAVEDDTPITPPPIVVPPPVIPPPAPQLFGPSCLIAEDRKPFLNTRDLNKYIRTYTPSELCEYLDLSFTGYDGIVNPSALTYTLDPPLVVPTGQQGYNMIPPYPPTPFVDLTGKNVLVIGAAKNLGKAVATMFKDKGCNVVGTSRHPKCYDLSELTYPLLKCDVRTSKSVKSLFQKVMGTYFTNGQIDILVNCPGMHWYGDLADADGDDLSDMLNFQVGGYQRCTFNALPYMKHSNFCKVISFGSIAGTFPGGLGGYSIAKRALKAWNDIHMTDGMKRKAWGLSTYEPTFVLVEPGFIESTISIYESYTSSNADPNNVYSRAQKQVFMSLQAATNKMTTILGGQPDCPAAPADHCRNTPDFVAEAIYQISIAPQPSVRYLIETAPPAQSFLSILPALATLSADQAITDITAPVLGGFFLDPTLINIAQPVAQDHFGCN